MNDPQIIEAVCVEDRFATGLSAVEYSSGFVRLSFYSDRKNHWDGTVERILVDRVVLTTENFEQVKRVLQGDSGREQLDALNGNAIGLLKN